MQPVPGAFNLGQLSPGEQSVNFLSMLFLNISRISALQKQHWPLIGHIALGCGGQIGITSLNRLQVQAPPIYGAIFWLLFIRNTLQIHQQKLPDTRYRSEEHTSELQSRPHLVCRLLLEKKKRDAKRRKEKESIMI